MLNRAWRPYIQVMSKITLLAFSLLSIPAVGFAQSDTFHRNNVTVGLGPAIPQGKDTSYLSAAPLVMIGYGYRFNRFFQADAGLQIAFGAANNQNAEQTELGPVQGRDREYMIPLGGRVYIPTPFKRIEVSAGAGAVHLHYSESVPSTEFQSLSCFTCTSRGGWGGYGLASVKYFLDENRNFHVGTTFQFISASTNGQAVGSTPGTKTTDHWANLAFVFGLSF